MNLMPTSTKVWIEEDCITCDACEDILPEVFSITDDSSFIKAEVREDGKFDRNTGFSMIKPEFRAEYSDIIEEAAEACPVEIIKFEYEAVEADGAPATPVEEIVEATPVAIETSADDGVLVGVLAGDRSLAVFFGSQTGNAAGLAEKTVKMAANFGLDASVIDMDGYDQSRLSSHKRVLIITSTWGEGEMPDNAESLWIATCASNPSLSGIHYSICAIGDTSYDEYCKAGHDWDGKFSDLGATCIQAIQECDVDFDEPWAQWVDQVLPRIACVDADGVFQEELVEAMIAYGAGDEEVPADDGDFSPGQIEQPEISLTLKIFRYDPIKAQSGYDTVACVLPGHATIQDALIAIAREIDGSLTFNQGQIGGLSPLTGLKANGRIVSADTMRLCDLVAADGTLTLEPLPGYEVVKDLMVSYDRYDTDRANSKPWMVADPRQGERLASGAPMGVMASAKATALHAMADVGGLQMINSMSDTYMVDDNYSGPGLNLQRWVRSQDPRSGSGHQRSMFDLLQKNGGVWDEADISSIYRHGIDGAQAADALYAARARLLAEFKFTGKPGRMVKGYSRSVKLTGNVNETSLYRSVLGPLGLGSNIMNGVSLRMMLGFTRNGGPMMRGFQGMLAPPAGIGKIPDMINFKVDNHHEIVAIFNKLDRRF